MCARASRESSRYLLAEEDAAGLKDGVNCKPGLDDWRWNQECATSMAGRSQLHMHWPGKLWKRRRECGMLSKADRPMVWRLWVMWPSDGIEHGSQCVPADFNEGSTWCGIFWAIQKSTICNSCAARFSVRCPL